LRVLGFEVVMTRSDDSALAGTKKEDMYRRLEIINGSPDAILVSIHQNHFSQGKYYGAQMFFGSGYKDESRALALNLQENFKNNLIAGNTREVKPAPSDLFLFKKSPCPSVLIECGFLSNYDEARLLKNDEYQNKIACTIAQSISEFVSNDTTERIT
ncbi:MAG: N-acetylmuramoyl-L-alanine amidase, partial [Oscillospiraceae bacterium]|nr:N-acetylmuramoyl-L-alanine amidase [Oscillospiraceae bacterium]